MSSCDLGQDGFTVPIHFLYRSAQCEDGRSVPVKCLEMSSRRGCCSEAGANCPGVNAPTINE